MNNNELKHYGILGMKWGVRRTQAQLGNLNLKKARTANFDKWGKDPEHNVAYISGYSGSGKSTTALSLAKPGDKVIHLDAYSECGYDVRCFGFDPYNAKEFVERWESENGPFGIVKVIQGARTESVPLGELKKLSEERMLLFDEELMSFAMGNCITLEDTNSNRKLFKRRYEQKIDAVAAMMDAYIAYKAKLYMYLSKFLKSKIALTIIIGKAMINSKILATMNKIIPIITVSFLVRPNDLPDANLCWHFVFKRMRMRNTGKNFP